MSWCGSYTGERERLSDAAAAAIDVHVPVGALAAAATLRDKDDHIHAGHDGCCVVIGPGAGSGST